MNRPTIFSPLDEAAAAAAQLVDWNTVPSPPAAVAAAQLWKREVWGGVMNTGTLQPRNTFWVENFLRAPDVMEASASACEAKKSSLRGLSSGRSSTTGIALSPTKSACLSLRTYSTVQHSTIPNTPHTSERNEDRKKKYRSDQQANEVGALVQGD